MTRALAFGLAAAALALGVAHAAQHWGGLPPCPLCLWQRYPYWAAIGLGLAGLLLPARFGPAAVAGLAVLFLGNAALAGFHAGVEWGAWPSPVPACALPAAAPASTVEELLAALPPLAAIPCDAAPIRLLGLSLAGWNALYALTVGSALGLWAVRGRG